MIRNDFSPDGTRRLRVLLVSGAVCALFALLTAASSFARPPAPYHLEGALGPASQQAYQSFAVDAAGDAAVIWQAETGAETYVAQVATRPAGGGWSAPQTVSPAAYVESSSGGGGGPTPFFDTAITFGPKGEAIAVWGRETAVGHQIEASSLSAVGAIWGSAEPLSGVGRDCYAPTVAIGPQGLTIVAWESNNTEGVEAAERSPGGSWSIPTILSKPQGEEHAVNATVKFDATGNALMTWNGGHLVIGKEGVVSDYRPVGGSWQGPVSATPESNVSGEEEFAFDAAGKATMIYSFNTGTAARAEVVELPAGGSWSAPTILDATGISHPRIAVDAAGDAVAGWQNQDGTPVEAQATSRPAGGSWQSITTLASASSTEERNIELGLTIAADGSAFATWSHYDPGSLNRIEFATMAAGGAWSTKDPLSLAGATEPTMVANASGQTVGGWQREGELETFVYDPVPPQIESSEIPTTGEVGEEIEFGVDPLDIVGTEVLWEFGDGATEEGAQVSHVYAAAGTYPVVANVENDFGKVTKVEGQIVIGGPEENSGGGETPGGGESPAGGTPGGETSTGGSTTTTTGGSTTTDSNQSSTPQSSAPPTSTPPAAPAWVALAEVARDKTSGNGNLVLKAPGPGTMTVSGPGVKTTTTKVTGKGAGVKIALTPKGSFKARLMGSHHRGWTTVTIVYTPAGGGPAITTTRRVRLVKR